MTVASVAFDFYRIDDAESITGWSSIGGGPGAASEGAFPYQSDNLVNRKITSSTGAGFFYQPSNDGWVTPIDFDGTYCLMMKTVVSDYGGLQTANGLRARTGSTSANYAVHTIAGTNSTISALAEYPPKGGLIIAPFDPSIAGYQTSVTGTPDFADVDFFATVAAFSASTAKSENVGTDAIDMARGLTITGGTDPDPAAVFQTAVDADEGVITQRIGMATAGPNFYGTIEAGSIANAVRMEDTDKTLTFNDYMGPAGWNRLKYNLGNAATLINNTRITVDSKGNTTTTDTRCVVEIVGTAAPQTINSHTCNNVASVDAIAGVTLESWIVNASGPVNQNGATLSNLVVNAATDGTGISVDDPTLITGGSVNDSGIGWDYTGAATSINVDGVTFSGNTTDIQVNNASDVTITPINGATVTTATNIGAGNVTISNGVPITVTVLDDATNLPIANAHVLLLLDSDKVTQVLNGITNGAGVASASYNYSGPEAIVGWARQHDLAGDDYTPSDIVGNISASGFDLTIKLRKI